MACKFCAKSTFKEKLGRCQFCMWLNMLLLVASASGWFICYQSSPRAVATIALLLTFIAAAQLMLLHICAYIYYRVQGVKNPTADKHNLK